MTLQGIFLADGPSDLPLARHLEALCAESGVDVSLIAVDPRLLRGAGRTVAGRLKFLADQQIAYEIVFIHRDSEAQDPLTRYEEISEAAAAVNLRCPAVPVVPVRMTEAWLLLDEASIRSVAAKPAGRTDLNLPPPRRVETIPDPKQRLRDALLVASETSGRRRKQFERDFGRHRALLLERLDTTGAVSGLPSWQRLQREVTDAVQHLKG